MSPDGIAAARRRIELRLVDEAKKFRNTCARTSHEFTRHGTYHSSMHVLSIYSHCEDELSVRTKIAWDIIKSVIDSEGFAPSDDNAVQIRAILEEVVTKGSRDIDEAYADTRRGMSGNWPDLSEARGGLAFLDTKSGRHKWMNCSIVTAMMPIERSRHHEAVTQKPFLEV